MRPYRTLKAASARAFTLAEGCNVTLVHKLEDDSAAVLDDAPGQPRVLEESEITTPVIAVWNQSVRLVPDVEAFEAELHLYALRDGDVLEDGHVRPQIARTGEVISARVPITELVPGKVVETDRPWVCGIRPIGERGRIQNTIGVDGHT